jgi:uncharacterized protein YutE (UPF0331/DUF86 family)
LIDDLLGKTAVSQYEIIALGTLLQNVYQGLEGILRYLIQEAGISFQKSESWHKELLQKSLDQGFITKAQFNDFLELLLFRHMHVHGYGYMLDEKRLREIASPITGICRDFLKTIK